MRPVLHIGYHKTGTTWLQKRVFPESAGAGFSFIANPMSVLFNFFPVEPFTFQPSTAHKRFEKEILDAESRGLVPVISHERLSGSPYAGGHDSRAIAERLFSVFPEARVLVAIREQRSVILSIYKQYVRWGGAASIEQFLNPPPGVNRIPVFRYGFYEYHHLVGYYKSLFGAENVLTLPYELLVTSHEDFLGRICEFLGTPYMVPKRNRDNTSPSAFSLAFKRQANRFLVRDALNPAPLLEYAGANDVLREAAKIVDRKILAQLRERHERRWRRRIEDQVGARYAESNDLTAELTGLDLESLGYT